MKGALDHQIHIEQLRLSAHVGVPEKERAKRQKLIANITVWPRTQSCDLCDDVAKTVNYSQVCRETDEFVRARSDKLIETLVDALAEHLIRKFPVAKVKIELRKFVLTNAKYVSVIVTRTAVEG